MPQNLCRCCNTRHTAPSGALLQLHALGQHAPALVLIHHLNSAAFVLDLGWRGGGEAGNHLDGRPTAVSRHRVGGKRRPRACPSACPSCSPVRCPIRAVVLCHVASLGAGHRRCVGSGRELLTGTDLSDRGWQNPPATLGAPSRATLVVQLLPRPRTVHSERSASSDERQGARLERVLLLLVPLLGVHCDLEATSRHVTKRQALALEKTGGSCAKRECTCTAVQQMCTATRIQAIRTRSRVCCAPPPPHSC